MVLIASTNDPDARTDLLAAVLLAPAIIEAIIAFYRLGAKHETSIWVLLGATVAAYAFVLGATILVEPSVVGALGLTLATALALACAAWVGSK